MSALKSANPVRKDYASLVSAPTPPHNMEAEQGLLGALLVSNTALERISHILSPDQFYAGVHGRIYAAIVSLVDRGQGASPVTLKPYFQNDPDLEGLGGAAYLADLAANVISVINTEDFRLLKFAKTRNEIGMNGFPAQDRVDRHAISIPAVGLSLSAFFGTTYLLCVAFKLLVPDVGSHLPWFQFFPGFDWTPAGILIGLAESIIYAWYVALLFGSFYNFFASRQS